MGQGARTGPARGEAGAGGRTGRRAFRCRGGGAARGSGGTWSVLSVSLSLSLSRFDRPRPGPFRRLRRPAMFCPTRCFDQILGWFCPTLAACGVRACCGQTPGVMGQLRSVFPTFGAILTKVGAFSASTVSTNFRASAKFGPCRPHVWRARLNVGRLRPNLWRVCRKLDHFDQSWARKAVRPCCTARRHGTATFPRLRRLRCQASRWVECERNPRIIRGKSSQGLKEPMLLHMWRQPQIPILSQKESQTSGTIAGSFPT